MHMLIYIFFFSSRRRHTRFDCDWSSDVCSSDIQLRSLIVGLYGFLDLADFGLGLCQVVVVRGKGPEVVWFFLGLGLDRFLFDVNCFLIIAHGLGVPPRFLSRGGLLRS